MPELIPGNIAVLGDIPFNYGYLAQPPIAWHSAAPEWNNESGTAVEGRHHKAVGEVYAAPTYKKQDTYISGTAGRTGRPFTVVSGTWKDDVKDPQYDQYGLFAADGSSGAPQAEVTTAATTQQVEHAGIVIHRDFAAIAGGPRDRSNNFFYVQFAFGQSTDYRFAYEFGQPFRLDVSYNGGLSWQQGVAIASQLGNGDAFLKSNRGEIRLKVIPDYENDIFILEIGDHHDTLRHKPKSDPKVNAGNGLPLIGNIRLVSKGASTRFWYYPLRYPTPPTIKKSPKDFGMVLQNTDKAVVSVNARTNSPADQQTQYSFDTTDGQNFTANVSVARPDAGDGLGSNTPARISDFTAYIPPVFRNEVDGQPDGRTANLRVMHVDSMSLCDDITCSVSYAAHLTCNNYDLSYSGAYGRFAVALDQSNGGPFVRQCTGIAGDKEGIGALRQDPARLLTLPVCDSSCQLMRALGQEVDFDGWPWPAVIRFLANAGGISDDFLQYIPYWPPGQADATCPYYTLRRGTGIHPSQLYYRQQIIWSIMLEIVHQLSGIDPLTQLPIPFYVGFDAYRQLHCEPISFISQPPSAFYSTNTPLTGGIPIEHLDTFTSVADMRSSSDLFGIDPRSFELLYLHLPQSPQVLKAMGYPVPLIEQSPAFVSLEYMNFVGNAYNFQTGIPLLTLRLKTLFVPTVLAGQTVDVWAQELGGVQRFKIDCVRSSNGWMGNSPYRDCTSVIDMRSILNTI